MDDETKLGWIFYLISFQETNLLQYLSAIDILNLGRVSKYAYNEIYKKSFYYFTILEKILLNVPISVGTEYGFESNHHSIWVEYLKINSSMSQGFILSLLSVVLNKEYTTLQCYYSQQHPDHFIKDKFVLPKLTTVHKQKIERPFLQPLIDVFVKRLRSLQEHLLKTITTH